MAKFYEKVGFAVTKEVDPINRPGIFKDVIEDHWYVGDPVTNITGRWLDSSQVNDNLKIAQKFSIVADPYAYRNYHAIKYIWYMGVRWKVTFVEVNRPRLVLTTGGEYNQ